MPEGLEEVTLEEFWRRLPEADGLWRDRISGSAPLHAVARFQSGRISVRVEPVDPDGSLGSLSDAEVSVAFHTERYGRTPLVVRGPGASAEVTAAVLLADVVRAVEAMR